MKKYLLVLLVPFSAFADTCHLEQIGGGEWRIVCEGSGLQLNYVDVTNEVYVIENCEEIKSALLSSASRISQTIEGSFYPRLSSISSSASDIQNISSDSTVDSYATTIISNVRQMERGLGLIQADLTDTELPDSLAQSISSINCGSCPTNGASGGGSGGSCCDVDLTEIIQRLIVAEQQRAVISNQIARISNTLGVVTNQLAYNNFLLEHGFGAITNQLQYDVLNLMGFDTTWNFDYNGNWHFEDLYFPYEEPASVASMLAPLTYNTMYGISSLNNFNHSFFQPSFVNLTNTVVSISKVVEHGIGAITNELVSFHEDTTNFFTFFRGEIGVRGVLEDWQSEEVSGTYYDFLTNHYLSVVFGESLSGYQAEKTNWFSRIETLLAALVFVDESETNAYLSASEASSNSVSNAKDSFNSVFDGVSSAPSTQMEMAADIEKSMYNSLKSFSQAFSSASLPSTVRLLYVYKDGGGGGSLRKGALRSSGGSVDVSVDVDGKLADFIEILRSCSTLCWVFFGLWFMFKFTVWTVKKIYFLIRYIIDFFNMVAGGK